MLFLYFTKGGGITSLKTNNIESKVNTEECKTAIRKKQPDFCVIGGVNFYKKLLKTLEITIFIKKNIIFRSKNRQPGKYNTFCNS